ncbi:MAG: hypothetical protein ACRDIB_07935 [Ardenticatenaceae bacterium]
MAKRFRAQGLTSYFGSTAFDMDVEGIYERGSRAYLEHRLAQIEVWMPYLMRRLGDGYRRAGGPCGHTVQGGDTASAALDVAYLQAVHRALYEALQAL